MRLAKYPKYAPSGIDGVSDVPSHWTVKKITTLFRRIGSGTTPRSDLDGYYDGDIPWVTTSELRETTIVATKQRISRRAVADHSALHLYPPGTILFAMYGATIGRLGILGIAATVNQACCAFSQGIDIEPKFAFYWLLMRKPVLVGLSYGGGQPNLSQHDLRQIRVALPPPSEQRAIVDYLDRATAKIDALIEKKRRFIELLEEKRAALTTESVTSGLDQSSSLKETEVAWLARIPKHWNFLSLARLSISRCDGPFGSGLKSDHYSDAGVRVVRLQNIGFAQFDGEDKAYIDTDYAKELGDHSVRAGDLLIAGLGDEGHPVGRACEAPADIEPAMVKADCFRFRLDRRRILPRFAAYQLSSVAAAVAGTLATGATRARMNLSVTATRKLALPPLDEQQAIVTFLDSKEKSFQLLRNRTTDAISLLSEYRSVLIASAVTGKIDVREASAMG